MSLFKDKAIKMYRITFNQYTNTYPGNTVRHEEDDMNFLHCDTNGTLIIREEDFDFYRHYGEGIKSMEYIGIFYEGGNND